MIYFEKSHIFSTRLYKTQAEIERKLISCVLKDENIFPTSVIIDKFQSPLMYDLDEIGYVVTGLRYLGPQDWARG